MGALIYDGARVEFDDSTLAHLQIVLVRFLQRRTSVLLGWYDSFSDGDGRTAMWISASLPMRFEFAGPGLPQIDREWIEHLSASASSRSGLMVLDVQGRPVRPKHSSIPGG